MLAGSRANNGTAESALEEEWIAIAQAIGRGLARSQRSENESGTRGETRPPPERQAIESVKQSDSDATRR